MAVDALSWSPLSTLLVTGTISVAAEHSAANHLKLGLALFLLQMMVRVSESFSAQVFLGTDLFHDLSPQWLV